jgi:hypothetical protein
VIFFVFAKNDFHIERVCFDSCFFGDMMEKLCRFFFVFTP